MEKRRPRIIGIMYELENGDISYWQQVALPVEDEEMIARILENHQTEGDSEIYSSFREFCEERLKILDHII